LAKEYTTVENIVARLANRYGEATLRAMGRLPAVDSGINENLDKLAAWTEQLSAALPKSTGGRGGNGNGGSYTAVLDRGDSDGEGVRLEIRKVQHGMSTTRYLPREFFETNEYAHIVSLAAKLNGLIGAGAYIERGDKQVNVESFAQAIDWLMAEARKGQSVQRYKGLGEMN